MNRQSRGRRFHEQYESLRVALQASEQCKNVFIQARLMPFVDLMALLNVGLDLNPPGG
jgi:hypothetical protein